MDTENAPQYIEIGHQSANFTTHDVTFVAGTSKFAVSGISTGGKGALSLYELSDGEVKLAFESSSARPSGIKCTTLGASLADNRHLAVGDFSGCLTILDLDRMGADGGAVDALAAETFSVKASQGIVNAIDGIGGRLGGGAPEIATAGKDGAVRVWDPRVDQPVVSLESEDGARDCWAVAFGNAYNNEERCLCAGYDNGDLKLFDLKMGGKLRWETNCGNGITSVQFDRPDIEMNKLVVSTLESRFRIYDVRTQHPTLGFTSLTEKAHRSTVWTAKHLPQNRDIFATCGGNGGLNLYKYSYPMNRSKKHEDDGAPVGVMGNVELLNSRIISTQPVVAFDWSPDKEGLACTAALDQTVRVYVVTKLDKY